MVKHFEDALQEVERARARVKGGGEGLGAPQRGGAGEDGVYDLGGGSEQQQLEDFGGRGAVNALELARAALVVERWVWRAGNCDGVVFL